MTLSLPAALASGLFCLVIVICLSDRIALEIKRWNGRREYRKGWNVEKNELIRADTDRAAQQAAG